MSPADLPAYTSASQLSMYSSCPRRYAYRYIERIEPELRTPGLALGSAVHATVEWWFEERAQERLPKRAEVMRMLRADLGAALAVENLRWGENTPEKLALEAEQLVRVFLDHCGDLDAKETEVRFDLIITDPTTGEQMPRPLVGYFDMELGAGNLVELKTAKRAYSKTELATNLQFAAYRTAARYFGVDVELYALVRNKKPRVQHVVLPHDRDVSRWFMKAASEIERAISSRQFPPAPGLFCSACEYRRRCLGVEATDDADEVSDDAEAA